MSKTVTRASCAWIHGLEAAGIVLFLIRAIVALLPILVLIVLPGALLVKLGLKVVRRRRPVAEPAMAAASE